MCRQNTNQYRSMLVVPEGCSRGKVSGLLQAVAKWTHNNLLSTSQAYVQSEQSQTLSTNTQLLLIVLDNCMQPHRPSSLSQPARHLCKMQMYVLTCP